MSELPLGFVKNGNLGDVRLKYVSHTRGEFLEASTNHDALYEE